MKKIENEEPFIEKDKFIILKLFIVLLILGLLGYSGYTLYQKKMLDNNNIVINLIKEKKESIKNNNIDNLKYNGVINLNLELNNTKTHDTFDDINFNVEGELDFNNKINNILVTTKYHNDNLLKFDIYEEKNQTFLYLHDYYDKYLELYRNSNIISFINKNHFNDLNTSFYDLIYNIIQENGLEAKDEEIAIKDEKITALNNTLTFKNQKANDLLINIYKEIIKNKNFIEYMTEMDFDIENIINNKINNLKNNNNFNTTINIYISKNIINRQIIRCEIISEINNFQLTIDNSNSDTIIIFKDDNIEIETDYDDKIIDSNIKLNDITKKIDIQAKFNLDEIKEIIHKDDIESIKVNELSQKDIDKIEKQLDFRNSFIDYIHTIIGIKNENKN